MKKISQTIFVLFLSLHVVLGQNKLFPVILNYSKYIDTLKSIVVPTEIRQDQKRFSGIPSDVIDYKIKYFPISGFQNWYYKYKNKFTTKDEYTKILKYFKNDTSTLFKGEGFKGDINVLYAITSGNKILVIIDENNNYNFADDHKYIVDTLRKLEYTKFTKVKNIEFYNKNHLSKRIYYVKPSPQTNNYIRDSTENKWNLSIQVSHCLTGKSKIDNSLIHFQLYEDLYNDGIFTGKDVWLYAIPDSIYKLHNYYSWVAVKINDTFTINNKEYRFEKVSVLGDTIYLQKCNIEKSGYNVGEKVLNFKVYNPLTKNDFNYQNNRKKYLLIDFWGTWCNPCIEAIPKLRELYNLYHSNIDFLSVAYDKKESLELVKTFIDSLGIKWNNLVEFKDYNSNESLIKMLKIQAYPTTILISANGVIVYRSEGLTTITDLDKFLKELSKQNFTNE